MGLSIVRQTLDVYSATITVNSDEGETAFCVTVPK
jgi:nitrogen-specific signal transduction histidine kinase